jgi:hypothetical protein
MDMNTCIRFLLFTFTLAFGFSAHADISQFDVLLDGPVTDGVNFDVEGHFATITFGGGAQSLPNDLVPAPPFSPGNNLWVTAQSGSQNGVNDVSLLFFGGDGTSVPPAQSAFGPLFVNPLDFSRNVLLGVDGLSGLGSSIADVSIEALFNGGSTATPITPDLVNISGTGSSSDPFSLLFKLEPGDLDGSSGMLVTFAVAPEPGYFWLLGAALTIFLCVRYYSFSESQPSTQMWAFGGTILRERLGRRAVRVALCTTGLALLTNSLHAGCSGGAGCARSDAATIDLMGVGTVNTSLVGFSDAAYVNSSCLMPGNLAFRRFEFAGDVNVLGPVRLYLDPTRVSLGVISPPQPDPPGLFPAQNRIAFYVRLDAPQLGLQLVSKSALVVAATIDSWPPPVGTTYQVQSPVEFLQRDPTTGAPNGPVVAVLTQNSHAQFYGAGPLNATILQTNSLGNAVQITGSLLSQINLNTIWHFYTIGKLLQLDEPVNEVAAFGPQAGRSSLQPGIAQSIPITGHMLVPGSEEIVFMAAAAQPFVFGDKAVVRVSLPDRGLEVTGISQQQIFAGNTSQLTITGNGFQAPISLSFSDKGITTQNIQLISPTQILATISVPATTAPTDNDLIVFSNNRTYTVADGVTILWNQPTITAVSPKTVKAGQTFTLDLVGDRFFDPSYLNLGDKVQIRRIQRISNQEIQVDASAKLATSGPVDIALTSANGTAQLNAGFNIVP